MPSKNGNTTEERCNVLCDVWIKVKKSKVSTECNMWCVNEASQKVQKMQSRAQSGKTAKLYDFSHFDNDDAEDHDDDDPGDDDDHYHNH